VLVHGGGQAAQNLTQLAWALSRVFTVCVPDRRGRGSSGLPGDRYGLTAESQDVDPLLRHSGSEFVFGLSLGALVCLDAALSLRQIRQLALYEPPVSVDHSTPVDWLARFDLEIGEGKIGSAMIKATRGTRTAPVLISGGEWLHFRAASPTEDRVGTGPAPSEGRGTGGRAQDGSADPPLLAPALVNPARVRSHSDRENGSEPGILH
jgi:pimeloyl-ACP methyl ester carboxylesterase